ncbi:hypothetical protein D3C81_1142290 [compost metagenome]
MLVITERIDSMFWLSRDNSLMAQPVASISSARRRIALVERETRATPLTVCSSAVTAACALPATSSAVEAISCMAVANCSSSCSFVCTRSAVWLASTEATVVLSRTCWALLTTSPMSVRRFCKNRLNCAATSDISSLPVTGSSRVRSPCPSLMSINESFRQSSGRSNIFTQNPRSNRLINTPRPVPTTARQPSTRAAAITTPSSRTMPMYQSMPLSWLRGMKATRRALPSWLISRSLLSRGGRSPAKTSP